MSFSGQIEDFPVIDIMQYIHAAGKSGILHFEKMEENARLYFQGGQIIRATRPEMANIGDLLLERNRISRNGLNSAIRIQKTSANPRPLGMILEEIGVITHRMLREAIISQIEDVIYETVGWEEGVFSFELKSHESPDDISFTPDDVIPPEEIDTQYLLLEAIRIFDETRNRIQQKNKILNDGNIDDALLPLEKTAINMAHEIIPSNGKLEYFVKCFSLFKKMLHEVHKDSQTQSVSVCFLNILSQHLDRAILFLVRRGELLGLVAFGNTTGDRPLISEIKNLRIPFEKDSLIGACIDKKRYFKGIPPVQNGLKKLQDKIGRPANREVMLLPVAGVDKMLCLVYGDNRLSEEPLNNIEILEIAAGQAGIILENNYLRKQVQRKSR
jgi:hypothetical protein